LYFQKKAVFLHSLFKASPMSKIKELEKSLIETKAHPAFNAGDNINVHYKIIEGNKERIQVFRGDVIQRKGSGVNQTFTVRKISNGIGVERIFPFNSPNIDKIEVNKKGKVRRAKIFYIRDLKGKASRIKELVQNTEE
jgi:large subunit ribosomal protein L19